MHGLDDLRFLFVENWLIPQDNRYWMPVRSGRVVNCKVAGDIGVLPKLPRMQFALQIFLEYVYDAPS